MGTIIRLQPDMIVVAMGSPECRKLTISQTALVVVDSFPCIWDHIRTFLSPRPMGKAYREFPLTDFPISRNLMECFEKQWAINISWVRYLPWIEFSLWSECSIKFTCVLGHKNNHHKIYKCIR